MQVITIDRANFLKGFSSSRYIDDKGFSSLSQGWETFRAGYEGLLLPGRSLTELSTNLADNVVASIPIYRPSAFYYYSVGHTGRFYRTQVSATLSHTALYRDTGKTYDSNSDILVFQGALYATSTTDILRSDFGFTGGDPVNNWWTGTKGKTALTAGVPHILFEANNTMYITNGNIIAGWDGTTATDALLTLPTGYVITAITIYGGYIKVAASLNYSASSSLYNTQTKIFTWGGVLPQWIREDPIDVPFVSAMRDVGGLLCIIGGYSLFVSDGFTFKQRYYDHYGGIPINWKQAVVNEGKLYWKCENGIMAYSKLYDSICQPIYTTADIKTFDIYFSDFIDIFGETNKCFRASENNFPSTFYSNYFELPQPSYIRKIDLVSNSALVENSDWSLFINDKETGLSSAYPFTYAADGAKTRRAFTGINHSTYSFRIQLQSNHSANPPIKYIKIYYEPAERHS